MAKKKKSSKKLFACGQCGGDVVMAKKTGHVEHYKHGQVKVPDGFPLPKCKKCGEVYFSGDREADMAHAIVEKLLKILNEKGIRY